MAWHASQSHMNSNHPPKVSTDLGVMEVVSIAVARAAPTNSVDPIALADASRTAREVLMVLLLCLVLEQLRKENKQNGNNKTKANKKTTQRKK